MRTISTLTAFSIFFASVSNIDAQDNTPEENRTVTPSSSPPANNAPNWLTRLSVAQQRQLQSLLQDASRYLSGIRVQEAFEKIIEAESMAPEYSAIHNLKGAAYTKIREFDKATAAFSRALELEPNSFMCRFNLTEMNFCKGKFAEAEKGFRQLMNTTSLSEDNKALMNFKILICRLKQDDESEAREILKAWDYLDDHPSFYFGNAAIHFNKTEEKKARKWLNAAKKIYSPAQISLYTDSLIECGWIDNFE